VKNLSEIIGDREASGVYLLKGLLRPREFERLAKERDLAFFHIEGKDIKDKGQFLDSSANILRFPDYFGNNWDAFEDCLTDMSWHVSEGYVVLYDRFDTLAENSPRDFRTVLKIFRQSVNFWRNEGKAFFIVLHGKGGEAQDLPTIKH